MLTSLPNSLLETGLINSVDNPNAFATLILKSYLVICNFGAEWKIPLFSCLIICKIDRAKSSAIIGELYSSVIILTFSFEINLLIFLNLILF